MMVKLNKCPFCGHEAVSISVYDVDEKWKGSLGCDFEKDRITAWHCMPYITKNG